jgi:DNA-binding LacI/PurR family transcriptional regulator
MTLQVTQTDIARQAGVTRLTVRRALLGQNGVGKVTAQRIRNLADELGYMPNAAANATRTGRFHAIGLLIGSVTPRYLPAELVHGVEEALTETQDQLLFSRLSDERLKDDQATPRMLQQLMVDGLLLHYTHRFPEELPERLARHRLPSIWINSRLSHDCVFFDDFAAARHATQCLLDRGHTRVAYVDRDPSGHYSEADRRAGYLAAMRDAGREPQIKELHYPTPAAPADTRLADAHAWLSGPDAPTAALVYSSTLMGPVATAALSLGRRIPQDLSLIGFGRDPVSAVGLPLTLVDTSMQGMAQRAVDMLRQKIAAPERRLEPAVLCPPLTGEHSLAPPVGVNP